MLLLPKTTWLLCYIIYYNFILDETKEKSGVISAKIYKTSLYVACKALDPFSCVISKEASTFALFDSKYNVDVAFEENTFEDESTTLDFKVCNEYYCS